MTLLEKAKKVAKKNGVKVKPDVARGLKAIQLMHNLSKKSKGSAYKLYISQEEK
jgi:hypothetical protein